MAAINALNTINCLGLVKNSGVPSCPLDPQFITGAIMVPRGSQFDVTANTNNVLTTLSALFYNASKTARFFPFYDFEKMTDSSDKLVLQSMPNGAKHPVREGYNDHVFQYFDGALTKHQAARTFNGSNWDWYYIDTNPNNGQQNIYGIVGSGPTMLQAFPCNPGGFFWAHPITFNTGTERTAYMLQYSFKQVYTNDLLAAFACPFTFETALPGLNDVIVQASATVSAVTKVFNICLVGRTGTDIGALNSAALSGSSGIALWTAAAAATPGTPTTITGIVWVPSTVTGVPGYFQITVSTPYPTPPAPMLFNLVAPAALVAAGVDYESTGALSIASV
jgi:hypothetical protein